MDKIKSMLNTYLLANAVLGTLEECPQGMPESTVYVALGSNYDLSVKLIEMLVKANAIQVKGHYITQSVNFAQCLENSRKGEATIKKLCANKGINL